MAHVTLFRMKSKPGEREAVVDMFDSWQRQRMPKVKGFVRSVIICSLKDPDEFRGLHPWDMSPERQPDGRLSAEKAKEMLAAAMRDGSHFFEWTHKRADGREFPATVLLSRMECGGEAILQATVIDHPAVSP